MAHGEPTKGLNPDKVADLLPLALQYMKFGVVGGGATIAHASLFGGLIEFAHIRPIIANLLAFLVAFILYFMGHNNWTFHATKASLRKTKTVMLRFLVVAITGLCLNSLAVYVITECLGASYWYAVATMVSVVPLLLFVMNKQWAFRSQSDELETGYATSRHCE